MSLTEGIFQRSNDLSAATVLDGNNAYNKTYTVVGIDKSTKKPVEAKKITNGLMSALKTADNISAKDNILVSYVFGGTPEQKEFTNVKNTDFLRAYQKGKAVKNADANKIDAKVTTFLSNKSIAKNKGAEDINLETSKEKEATKENPTKINKEVARDTNTNVINNTTNTEPATATNAEQQKKKAQYSKKVVNILQNAGIDIAPLTTDKSGVKKIKFSKVRDLVQKIKHVPGVTESLKEELEKLDKEYEQYIND